MMKDILKTIGLFLLAAGVLLPHTGAGAQTETGLELRMRRDFGYSALSTNEIQGTFTLTATGPDDLDTVIFYIDDQELGRVEQPPFQLRFSTDSYPLGAHTLSAVGQTASGQALNSNPISVEFVGVNVGWAAGMKILVPMLALVVAAILLSTLVTFAGARKLQNLPPGTPRHYGAAGGAICTRCGRPFSRHFLAPNMVFGKLERCPFCGKWSIVPAAPLALLRQAELAEVEQDQPEAPDLAAEDDRLRKALDESRYQD